MSDWTVREQRKELYLSLSFSSCWPNDSTDLTLALQELQDTCQNASTYSAWAWTVIIFSFCTQKAFVQLSWQKRFAATWTWWVLGVPFREEGNKCLLTALRASGKGEICTSDKHVTVPKRENGLQFLWDSTAEQVNQNPLLASPILFLAHGHRVMCYKPKLRALWE